MRWAEYEDGLETRLAELKDRIHRGAYRAQPSRRIYIPKADGRQRPIGIAALEDKIVQQAVVTILNEVYEVDFRGFCYGFRPGRGPHQALDALSVGIRRKKVNWILDADIRGFFDQMSHEWTMKFVQHRIADQRVLRLIQKWLKAGVSEEGEWSETKVGTPQGAVISPLLANVYLHYVFDLWLEAWREKVASGDVIAVRYADESCGGVSAPGGSRALAERVSGAAGEIRTGTAPRQDAADRVREVRAGEPESAEERESRKASRFWGSRMNAGTTVAGTLSSGGGRCANGWRRNCSRSSRRCASGCTNRCLTKVGEWLGRVLNGFYQYHAVPGNWASLNRFRERIGRYWRQALTRRSQRGRLKADRIARLFDRWLPRPRLLHPYPEVRFDATHPR